RALFLPEATACQGLPLRWSFVSTRNSNAPWRWARMKKTLFLAVAVCLVLSCVSLADAQTSAPAPGTPPKVITIIREEVKVGKGAAHEKFETNFVRAFARAKWPSHYLAMTALSGPSEAWYLTGYDSVAAWEQDRETTEKHTAFSADLAHSFEKETAFAPR